MLDLAAALKELKFKSLDSLVLYIYINIKVILSRTSAEYTITTTSCASEGILKHATPYFQHIGKLLDDTFPVIIRDV